MLASVSPLLASPATDVQRYEVLASHLARYALSQRASKEQVEQVILEALHSVALDAKHNATINHSPAHGSPSSLRLANENSSRVPPHSPATSVEARLMEQIEILQDRQKHLEQSIDRTHQYLRNLTANLEQRQQPTPAPHHQPTYNAWRRLSPASPQVVPKPNVAASPTHPNIRPDIRSAQPQQRTEPTTPYPVWHSRIGDQWSAERQSDADQIRMRDATIQDLQARIRSLEAYIDQARPSRSPSTNRAGWLPQPSPNRVVPNPQRHPARPKESLSSPQALRPIHHLSVSDPLRPLTSDSSWEVRSYYISSLITHPVSDVTRVIQIIQGSVDETSWKRGGSIRVVEPATTLQIVQTEENHQRISELLDVLIDQEERAHVPNFLQVPARVQSK